MTPEERALELLRQERADEAKWLFTSCCKVTGETHQIYLTDQEKHWVETRPGFTGWEKDELQELA